MKTHYLKHGNSYYAIKIKKEILSDNDFSYTESGNDITVTSYIGSDTDVKIVNKSNDMYCLALKDNSGKVNTIDYTYTYDGDTLILTKYIGTGVDIDTPIIEKNN